MEEIVCREEKRFESIEREIAELKMAAKENRENIVLLKESQSEMRVYIKQIFERLDDLKALFNSQFFNITKHEGNVIKEVNGGWIKVVIELIKAIGLVAAIVAGVKIFDLGG